MAADDASGYAEVILESSIRGVTSCLTIPEHKASGPNSWELRAGACDVYPRGDVAPRLVKSDAVQKIRKTRVAAHGIKEWMYLDELQDV